MRARWSLPRPRTRWSLSISRTGKRRRSSAFAAPVEFGHRAADQCGDHARREPGAGREFRHQSAKRRRLQDRAGRQAVRHRLEGLAAQADIDPRGRQTALRPGNQQERHAGTRREPGGQGGRCPLDQGQGGQAGRHGSHAGSRCRPWRSHPTAGTRWLRATPPTGLRCSTSTATP